VTTEPTITSEGQIELIISGEQASSISGLEQALLKTTFAAMRETLSNHLTQHSLQVAQSQAMADQVIKANESPYRVESELGRLTFITHHILQGSRVVYDTARDYFPGLHAAEWYQTTGFKEVALIDGVVNQSYRQTATHLNRIRHQPTATPSRSLANAVEKEAAAVIQAIEQIAHRVESSSNSPKSREFGPRQCISQEAIEQAMTSLQFPEHIPAKQHLAKIAANPLSYEDPMTTINVSVDTVSAKKQKESRSGKPTQDDRKRVHTTVSHIQYRSESYTVAGETIDQALDFTAGFLHHNQVERLQLQFFTDGERALKNAIIEQFANGPPMALILDWLHLADKCATLLSLALKGRETRNQIVQTLKSWLWLGLVDDAKKEIENIDPKWVKSQKALDQLSGYFERNRDHIPCYALRKELGLRNSSNHVEKMNDLILAERQKHNGMSWSQDGSFALAVITSLKLNQEYENWFENKKLNFKFKK